MMTPKLLLGFILAATTLSATVFNDRDYGAKGDGATLDSPAINDAISAAAAAGGGTVVLPAGTYLSFSIRLKSNITLHLDAGATLLAATPKDGFGQYDQPEPNDWGDKLQYQDFGHSHWQNSLIWGDGLQNVAITGPGLIDGTKGLIRNAGYGNGRRGAVGPDGTLPLGAGPATVTVASPVPPPAGVPPGAGPRNPAGQGNKAIGLKNCRNVTLRDFSLLNCGHFGLLATGVDHLTIKNLSVDTNRDGFDIDACRNVRVENCRVNAPHDDAIVLKTSYGLGEIRATENVVITGCTVTGFDAGTVQAGTRLRTLEHAPDRDGPTGRIKFGTESNGAFRHITITDCTFERSRGLALETVDGGIIEDVTVRNLTLSEISTPAIFIRLGNRGRGPEGTPIGAIRRVSISHVTAKDVDARYAAVLVAGLPGHPVEDLTLKDITIVSRGGLTQKVVAEQPAAMVNPFFLRGSETGATGPRDPFAVPLREKAYPEPSMFGLLPAGAVYASHVKNITVRNVAINFDQPDTRPRVVLDDVSGAAFKNFTVDPASEARAFVLRGVSHFAITHSPGVPDARHENADNLSL